MAAERKLTACFIDVQNDHSDHLASRVVVPLRRERAVGPRARDLNPLLAVGAEAVVMDTAALGAVPSNELRSPVASLVNDRALILEALDTLFGAY